MDKNTILTLLVLGAIVVFLSGCSSPPANKETSETGKTGYSFQDALAGFQSVDDKHKSAASLKELDEYAAEVKAYKEKQALGAANETERNAFAAFTDYRLKEIEAKKEFYKVADTVKPDIFTNPKNSDELQQIAGMADETANKIDEALNALNEFESNYKQFAGNVNIDEEKQILGELKNQINDLKNAVKEALEKLPAFKKFEGIKGEIEFEKAKEIVIGKLVEGNALVFSKPELIKKGTEVYQYGRTELDNLVWKTTDNVWFFWIDDFPNAEFAHPTRYVFVKNTGEYIVFNASFWPIINSKRAFTGAKTDLIYGTLSSPASNEANALSFSLSSNAVYFQEAPAATGFPTTTPCPCNEPSETYAIIIQGSPSVEPDGKKMSFGTNVNQVNDMLKGRGVSPDNIEFVAHTQNNNADVDASLSMANIRTAINNIKGKIKCCDVLFVYLATHGGLVCEITWTNWVTGKQTEETLENKKCPKKDEFSGVFWTATSVTYKSWFVINGTEGKEDPWAADFAALFDGIENCNTYFFIQACHSGGAIPDFQGKGRTIATSADTFSSSYSGGPGNPSPVTGAFVNGINGAEGADPDGDGTVSLLEGMNYGKDNFNGSDSKPQVWSLSPACDCPPKDCNGDETGTGTDNNAIEPPPVEPTVGVIPDASIQVLVDGTPTGYIDSNPSANNHVIIESSADLDLPLTLVLTGHDNADASDPAKWDYTVTISDSVLQCANPKKCSTDIDTTGITDGYTLINVTDSSGNTATDTITVSFHCTENWSCGEWSNWSECTAGTQARTRACTEANNCGTTALKPTETETQNCEETCTESWSCGEWGAWSDWTDCQESGTQTRTRTKECTDANNCGTTALKPETTETESQGCEYTPTEQKPEYSSHESSLGSNISNLNYSGDTASFDLTSSGGEYGYKILNIPSGATLKVCVAVTGGSDPLYFNAYPQYHYGYDWSTPEWEAANPGCITMHNKNAWANGALIHLGEPPANVQGNITVTQLN